MLITYKDHMGDDLRVANAARVSFAKWKEEFDIGDAKLIRYLVSHHHDSPLRHIVFTFHVEAPEFVFRQLYRHVVGSAWTPVNFAGHFGWNEKSLRYVDAREHWMPEKETWRKQHPTAKQGSLQETLDDEKTQEQAVNAYYDAVGTAFNAYARLLELGVCREQARAVLPLATITEALWTCSAQAALWLITLRDHDHAQYEIRVLAQQVTPILEKHIPVTLHAWNEFRRSLS